MLENNFLSSDFKFRNQTIYSRDPLQLSEAIPHHVPASQEAPC